MVPESQVAFVSYCRIDSEFAHRLAEDLKAAGAGVWMDQIDIHPGEPWDIAVERALNSCQQMLVVLSPVSAASANVLDEISLALKKHKRIIPVLYQDCEIPLRLHRIHYLDFRTDYASGLKGLVRTLAKEQHLDLSSTVVLEERRSALDTEIFRRRIAKEQGEAESRQQEQDRAAEQQKLEQAQETARQQKLAQESAKAAEQERLEREQLEQAKALAVQQQRSEQAREAARLQALERERQRVAEEERVQLEQARISEEQRLEREGRKAQESSAPASSEVIVGNAVELIVEVPASALLYRTIQKDYREP